jgi:hypothetical protein
VSGRDPKRDPEPECDLDLEKEPLHNRSLKEMGGDILQKVMQALKLKDKGDDRMSPFEKPSQMGSRAAEPGRMGMGGPRPLPEDDVMPLLIKVVEPEDDEA